MDNNAHIKRKAQELARKGNLAAAAEHRAVVADLDRQLTAFFERYADPQWDVWRGGTAKATLVYGNRNQRFAEHFPDWTPPVTRKAVAFRDPAAAPAR